MRVFLVELLRDGNMDIYQISRIEVVCFAFHDDLLFQLDTGKKADYRLHPAGIKRFFRIEKKLSMGCSEKPSAAIP